MKRFAVIVTVLALVALVFALTATTNVAVGLPLFCMRVIWRRAFPERARPKSTVASLMEGSALLIGAARVGRRR